MKTQWNHELYAYLAGILDGEGCLRISRTNQKDMVNPYFQASIQVGMQDKRVLEMFKTTFGGSIYKDRTVNGKLPVYRWRINSKRGSIKCLKKLMPYLITKREQAEILLSFCKNTPPPKKRSAGLSQEQLKLREDLFNKIKKLKECIGPLTTERRDRRELEATV